MGIGFAERWENNQRQERTFTRQLNEGIEFNDLSVLTVDELNNLRNAARTCRDDNLLGELGHEFFRRGEYDFSRLCFMNNGDSVNRDRAYMKQIIQEAMVDPPDLHEFFDPDFGLNLESASRKWAEDRGFDDIGKTMNLIPIAKAANELVGQYDICLAIAKSGLQTGFIFDSFGHNVKVVETHRNDSEGNINLFGLDKSDFEGKKVLIMDYDIVTGVTSSRILDKVKELGASSCDFFTATPYGHVEAGTRNIQIPSGFNDFIHPSLFHINEQFPDVVEKLKSLAQDDN